MILLNYKVFLVLVAIACVEGLVGTEHQNAESFLKIIQVKLDLRNIFISLKIS